MFSALVVVLATFAFANASPVAERQSGCTPQNVPSQCTDAQTQFEQRFAQIVANPTSMSAQQIRDIFVPFLNTLCNSTCLSPGVNNLRCTNQANLLNFTLTGICGRNGDTYCLIEFVDLSINGTNPLPTCASTGSCPSSCRNTLSTITNRMGCCAASLYGNSASPYYSAVAPTIRTCGVSLGRVCPAATGAGSTTAHYLSALLLFAVAALAIAVL